MCLILFISSLGKQFLRLDITGKCITQMYVSPQFHPISFHLFYDLWLLQYINEIVVKILVHVKLRPVIHHCCKRRAINTSFVRCHPEMLLICVKINSASSCNFFHCTASNTNAHLTLHNR